MNVTVDKDRVDRISNTQKTKQLKQLISLYPKIKIDIYGVILEYCSLTDSSLQSLLLNNTELYPSLNLPKDFKKLTNLIDILHVNKESLLIKLLESSKSNDWGFISQAITSLLENKDTIAMERTNEVQVDLLTLEEKTTVINSKFGVHLLSKPTKNFKFDIVFIHGWKANAVKTWSYSNDSNSFWPQWLDDDLPDSRVWVLSYPTNITNTSKFTTNLEDTGHSLIDGLRDNSIGTKPIIFIVHSMGGLVLKHMLTDTQNQKYGNILQNTKGIAFIATPHNGVPESDIAQFFSVPLSSEQVKEMSPFSKPLQETSNNFRNYLIKYPSIHCTAYKEGARVQFKDIINDKSGILWKPIKFLSKKPIINRILSNQIVPDTSGDPQISTVEVVSILGEDHISISKPENREADIYKKISKTFLEETFSNNPSS